MIKNYSTGFFSFCTISLTGNMSKLKRLYQSGGIFVSEYHLGIARDNKTTCRVAYITDKMAVNLPDFYIFPILLCFVSFLKDSVLFNQK